MQVILQLETLSRAGNRHLPCNNTYHNYSSSAAVAADRNCWHLALFMSYYFVVFAAFRRSNHGDARRGRGLGKCRGAYERGLPSGIFRCALNGNETFAVAQNANARTLPTTHTHTQDIRGHTHIERYVQVLFIYRIYAHIYAEIQYIMPYVEELQI